MSDVGHPIGSLTCGASDVGRSEPEKSEVSSLCGDDLAESATTTAAPERGWRDASLDEVRPIIEQQIARWKSTLDWLAER